MAEELQADAPLPKRRAQSGERPPEAPEVAPAPAATLRVNAGLTDNCLQGVVVMLCAPVGVIVGLLALGRLGGVVFGLIGGLVAGLILGSAILSIRRAAAARAARRGPADPS
jgi:hypothetical protein